MDAEERRKRVGVFVGVVVVVALVVGLVAALGGSGPGDTSVGYTNTSDLVPEQVEANDEVVGEDAVGTGSRVVLVDDSHANRFEDDDLRSLIGALSPRHEVVFTSDSRGDLDESLSEADAYVVIDPSVPHTEEEATAVEEFIDGGGRVILLGEPTRVGVSQGPLGGSLIDIRSRMGRLSTRLGVAFGTDYLYDEVNNDGNYKRVLADGRGSLEGNRTALYTATTVEAPDGERLLVTPETTRLSARSEARRHPVAVRTGNVVAVGDTTFLAGGKAVVADNERLVRTLAAFAVGGNRSRGVADYPHFLSEEPRVRYTSGELLNATKAIAGDVRATGRSPTVSASTQSLAPERTDVLVTTFEDLEGMNATGTGFELTATSVSVPGYDGPRDRVAVVHRPEGPFDLVVAAASPDRARAVARRMADGRIREDVLSDRTAVLVGPEDESDGTETPSGGTPSPPTGGEPGTPPGGGPAPSPEGANASLADPGVRPG